MSDPQNLIVEDYVTPSDEELRARRKRNMAIGLSLVGFVVFIFFLMLFKLGFFK